MRRRTILRQVRTRRKSAEDFARTPSATAGEAAAGSSWISPDKTLNPHLPFVGPTKPGHTHQSEGLASISRGFSEATPPEFGPSEERTPKGCQQSGWTREARCHPFRMHSGFDGIPGVSSHSALLNPLLMDGNPSGCRQTSGKGWKRCPTCSSRLRFAQPCCPQSMPNRPTLNRAVSVPFLRRSIAAASPPPRAGCYG
jgi:hypothetical protein